MVALRHVVVVGASLAGIRAAQELRLQGYDGAVTLIGAEDALPYDRPPLSKELLLGTKSEADLRLCDDAELDGLDVELRLGSRATRLDVDRREVHLEDGDRVVYDGLIIATGAAPRMPAGALPEGVHALRTLDDALAIRDAMRSGARVAIVGAGFVGLEVASAARALALDVTVLEALETPLELALGADVGSFLGEFHRSHGVDVRCGSRVERFEGADRLEALSLDNGDRVDADLVVVGIGVTPNTEWLRDSGLQIDDGVLCDDRCAAIGAEHVYAAGDVARIAHPVLGERVRIEHWTNAGGQAVVAARNLLGAAAPEPYAELPYFWSYQHGARIQLVGSYRIGDDFTLVDGALEASGFAGVYNRDGRAVGCVGFNRPAVVMRSVALIEAGAETQAVTAAL